MSGVWAVTMVRDEADIIAITLAHMLAEGCDRVLVADNLSTDGTREILDDLAAGDDRITVVDDLEPAYWQGRKMTALAHQAGDMGANWIVPFDADELWYSPTLTLAETLRATDADVLLAKTWEHVPSPADDQDEPNPVLRLRHRRRVPKPAPKVCFRYHPQARLWLGNHMVDRPGTKAADLVEIREFQYRSLAQAIRKLRNGKRAIEATTLAESEGAHWRTLGAMSDAEFAAWWAEYEAGDALYDPAPLRCPASPQ